MDEQEQGSEQEVQVSEVLDLETLIAVVEARIIENLAQMIERMAGKGS